MNEKMTIRELIEYVKRIPGFFQISNVDVIMGDVYGVAQIERTSGPSIQITIRVEEYLG
jgi:hypothetical protein